MKTASIPVYGNIVVYIKYCTKMLRLHLFSIFLIKTPWALASLPLRPQARRHWKMHSNYDILCNQISKRNQTNTTR